MHQHVINITCHQHVIHSALKSVSFLENPMSTDVTRNLAVAVLRPQGGQKTDRERQKVEMDVDQKFKENQTRSE
jgi:hypothetical protein